MAPPPSQAGKFKPRKPGKKIKLGAATTGAAETAAAAPTVAATRRGSSSSSRGRGGRKKRAHPVSLPRGAVYFTGNPTTTTTATAAAAGKRTGGGTTSGSTSTAAAAPAVAASQKGTTTGKDGNIIGPGGVVKMETGGASSEEVVVGELDVGIGSSAVAATDDTTKNNKESSTTSPSRQAADSRSDSIAPRSKTLVSMIDTYDSDSSSEEDHERARMLQQPKSSSSTLLPPTQLPFPLVSAPIGIGGNNHNRILYACQEKMDEEKKSKESDDEVVVVRQQDPPPSSPFVDANIAQRLQAEDKSWFLFQFPTRLPPLFSHEKQPDTTTCDGHYAEAEPALSSSAVSTSATAAHAPMDITSSSSEEKSFDNTLCRAGTGRLGKVIVYKSGKTVLVMGGQDGSPEIRMNVTEGLPCGFVQQAVAIDTEQGKYVPLGDVKKTVVLTPDVDRAFSSTQN